jgi:DNA modification methylase
MSWHPDIPLEYRNQIVTGDARELAKRIPDESVDLIFTDPPYLREFIPLYRWLAETAARVLKPGAYLFAYGAGEYIPDILDYMRVDGLKYFWVDVLLHHGGYPRVWYKKLMSGYKPVFVFTKGTPSMLAWRATVGADSADKRFHEWGQGDGLAMKILDQLTRPAAVIFDPFCGGGSTMSACTKSNRNYIAFEIDPSTAERARQRVQNTQPPLFVPQAEQLELEVTP